MTTATVAGLLMIVVAFAFNAAFALLAARFDYPDVLREPTADVLAKFRAGGTPLVLLWWAFALTAVRHGPARRAALGRDRRCRRDAARRRDRHRGARRAGAVPRARALA